MLELMELGANGVWSLDAGMLRNLLLCFSISAAAAAAAPPPSKHEIDNLGYVSSCKSKFAFYLQ